MFDNSGASPKLIGEKTEGFIQVDARALPPIAGAAVAAGVRSRTYEMFEEAMIDEKQIVCAYGGYARELCPIILGHSQGHEKVLAYQFGGRSSSRLPQGGRWKCLWLSKITDVRLREGPWISGSRHSQNQTCVEVVDLDVNPDSPYHPGRDLRRLRAERKHAGTHRRE
jgi:hypothetical protein